MAISKDLGPVSGFAVAVEYGFTGTEEEWIQLVLKGTENAQMASEKAKEAADSAEDASGSASSASISAANASASETNAEQSATAAAGSVVDAEASERNAAASAVAAAASAAEAQRVEQSIPEDYSELAEKVKTMDTNLQSGLEKDAIYHLGFYLDENGDLNQVDG